MQSGLGDQGIVVLLGEATRAVQGPGDDADCLELGAGVADRVLVNGECLGEELIAHFFEPRLVCNFSAHHEQPKRQVCTSRVHSLVQIVDTLVHKPVDCR